MIAGLIQHLSLTLLAFIGFTCGNLMHWPSHQSAACFLHLSRPPILWTANVLSFQAPSLAETQPETVPWITCWPEKEATAEKQIWLSNGQTFVSIGLTFTTKPWLWGIVWLVCLLVYYWLLLYIKRRSSFFAQRKQALRIIRTYKLGRIQHAGHHLMLSIIHLTPWDLILLVKLYTSAMLVQTHSPLWPVTVLMLTMVSLMTRLI